MLGLKCSIEKWICKNRNEIIFNNNWTITWTIVQVQVWVKSKIKKSINVLKMQFLHFISTKKLECP